MAARQSVLPAEADQSERVAILVDHVVRDVGPLVELARSLVLCGLRPLAVLVRRSVSDSVADIVAFQSVGAETVDIWHSQGRVGVKALEDALGYCRPAALVYMMQSRCMALSFERQHDVPAVLVGFQRAYLADDLPRRPSLRVRDTHDAAAAAQLLVRFFAFRSGMTGGSPESIPMKNSLRFPAFVRSF